MERTRNCRFLVSLTESEMETLSNQINRTGLTREAYMRRLIKGIQPKDLPNFDFFEVLKSLREINNNLISLAILAKEDKHVDDEAYWKNSKELQKNIGKIMEGIYDR